MDPMQESAAAWKLLLQTCCCPVQSRFLLSMSCVCVCVCVSQAQENPVPKKVNFFFFFLRMRYVYLRASLVVQW